MLPRRRQEDRGWREGPVCAVEKRLSLVFQAFGDTELPEDSGPPRRDIPRLFGIPTLKKPSLKRRAPEPAAGSGATLQRPPRFVSCSDGSNERKERAIYIDSASPLFTKTFTSTRRFNARPWESVFSAAG